MNTFHEEWVKYWQVVVPDNAEAVQILETKKAFYAGAFSALSLIWSGIIKKEYTDEDVEKTATLMLNLKEEVQKYLEHLIERGA